MMIPTIDPEFSALIPPLQADELAQLEANILQDGCRDPLTVWRGLLLDGHNRLMICQSHGLKFATVEVELASRDDALLWIIRNQFGRRNLPAIDRINLQVQAEPIIARLAKANLKTSTGGANPQPLPKLAKAGIDTRSESAKLAGVSHGTYDAGKRVIEAVKSGALPADTIDKIRAGDQSISGAAKSVIREARRADVLFNLEDVEAQAVKASAGVYDVIVIDPPWPMHKIERDVAPSQVEFEYPTMTIEEIASLEIPTAADCHVWLWTTQKYLPDALSLLEQWGLKYVCAFVWHKPGGFQPFGLPQFNCEFALYARKGSPEFIDFKNFMLCFNAPRGAHSEKPEAFYDVVRRVTAGRRLDMFNRREIIGFDTWGKEAK
jgi:N6-adenosine-specific RNA methylase IME4